MMLIGLAFVAMFLAIFDPRTGYTPSATRDVPAVDGDDKDDGGYGTPRRSMNIHQADASGAAPVETGAVLSARRVLIPKLPGASGPNLFGDAPLPLPTAMQRGARRDNEEDEDRLSTGWGWLADDIMASRRNQETTPLEDEEEQKQDAPSSTTSSIFSAGEKSEEAQHFFINPSFQPGGAERADERSVLRESGVDWQSESTRERTDFTDTSTLDSDNEREGGRAPSALEMRDPFSPAARVDSGFGESTRFAERTDDPFSRFRETATSFDRGGMQDTGRFREEERSPRIIGDARSDSSRLTSPWTGYSSDSIFNAGGGYTPSGIGSGGSDPAFSGSGVFGGDSMFSVSTPSAGLSGGMPIGGSGISQPALGSSSGSARQEADRTPAPRVLPW